VLILVVCFLRLSVILIFSDCIVELFLKVTKLIKFHLEINDMFINYMVIPSRDIAAIRSLTNYIMRCLPGRNSITELYVVASRDTLP